MSMIAVTGGLGRLGRYVAEHLSRSAKVRLVDSAVPSTNPEHEFVQCNVIDRRTLDGAFVGCDAIIHLAAKDLSSNASPEQFLTTNVVGTWNVCRAAEEAGVRRVVLVSSVAVLGLYDSPDLRPKYLPVDEEHPLLAIHPYGVSKLLSEQTAAAFARRGLDVTCLRLPMVAFPSEVASMAAAASDCSEPRLFCYIAPEDAACAAALAVFQGPEGWSVLNVAASDSYADAPTLDVLKKVHGHVPPVVEPGHFDRDARATILDTRAASRVLGFHPAYNWPRLSASRRHDTERK